MIRKRLSAIRWLIAKGIPILTTDAMSTGKVPCLMNWLYAEFEGCDTCKYYIGFSSQVTKGMCTLHSLLVNGDESPCVGYEEIPENENRSN